MDETTQVGPLATPDILEGLDQQVRRSVEMGARVLTGGKRLDRPGNYYAPTVLADVPKDAPAYGEELFGPVAALYRADGIEEAIRLANDTEFGLGASAWTNDQAEQRRFIDEIEAGMVFINGMVALRPAPALRRRQAVGVRARAGRLRHPRVRECEDGAPAPPGLSKLLYTS
jgi:succinate-semialdehyde dehydrogenase/glutarate-semialdehyde dehydrogenase